MKLKSIKKTVQVPHERDGITHMVTRTVTERVPVVPADWDSRALKAVSSLVLGLTLVAVAWSTVSIGELLGGGVGFAAAVVFDVAWAAVLIVEWMARFDPAKRTFARKLGWVLVAVTMGAIGLHGVLAGSWALAVVGALVSLVAKLLWLTVFRFVDKDLSEDDRQWVAAEISRANAQMAIAGVRRQAARAEARAAAELLAAERERAAWSGLDVPQAPVLAPVDVPELLAAGADPRPVTAAEDAAQRLVEAAARQRAIASTPDADAADHDRARRSLAEAAATYMTVAPPAEPEPVHEPLQYAAGSGADSRADMTPSQVTGPDGADDARPDSEDDREEYRVPPQAPPSLAAGVRELRAAKVDDPAVMAARLSALMGRDVPLASVKREIRRAKAAEQKAAGREDGTGAYL